jgi:exopolysaccharide biosynthesis predicted pyruvyltransferase EpsI
MDYSKNETLKSATFLQRIEAYRQTMCSYIHQLGPIKLLTELYGNIGDHLIWAGTEDLLNSRQIIFLKFPMSNFNSMGDTQKFPGETLIIPGSGAFVTFWHEWLPALVIKAAKVFDRVVILPSGYDASVPIVGEALAQKNVFAFAREPRSYSEIKRFGQSALAFDPALFFSAFHHKLPLNTSNNFSWKKKLIALRTDKGSLIPKHGYVQNPKINNDISLTSSNLTEFINAIKKVDFVITDRLHVAVAAVMMEKKLYYFDPYDKKISTYFSFVFRQTFGHLAIPCTLEWLKNNNFITQT